MKLLTSIITAGALLMGLAVTATAAPATLPGWPRSAPAAR